MHNDDSTPSNPYLDNDWMSGEAESGRAPDPSKLGFELGYFQSHRRYRRVSGLNADINVYGLFTFHARGLMFKDGFYRLIIPAGRKPEVLDSHLRQIAPGLDFYLLLLNVDSWLDTEAI